MNSDCNVTAVYSQYSAPKQCSSLEPEVIAARIGSRTTRSDAHAPAPSSPHTTAGVTASQALPSTLAAAKLDDVRFHKFEFELERPASRIATNPNGSHSTPPAAAEPPHLQEAAKGSWQSACKRTKNPFATGPAPSTAIHLPPCPAGSRRRPRRRPWPPPAVPALCPASPATAAARPRRRRRRGEAARCRAAATRTAPPIPRRGTGRGCRCWRRRSGG